MIMELTGMVQYRKIVEVPELPPTLNDEELTALKGLVESLDNTSSLEYSWRSQYIAARAFVSSCTE